MGRFLGRAEGNTKVNLSISAFCELLLDNNSGTAKFAIVNKLSIFLVVAAIAIKFIIINYCC